MKFLLILGVLWPFVLVAGLCATLVAGVDVSDGMATLVLGSTVLSIPAVAVALYRSLPSRWSDDRRYVTAGLLVLPVFAAEVCFALGMLAVAMRSFGFAPA